VCVWDAVTEIDYVFLQERERERVSHLPSCNNKTAIQNVTKMLALFSFQNDREPNVADRSEPK
jgi:hypothetical protein